MLHEDDFFERCHLSKNMFGQGEEAEELKAQECGPEVGRERLIQRAGQRAEGVPRQWCILSGEWQALKVSEGFSLNVVTFSYFFMCFSVCRCSWLTLGIGGGSLWFGDCIYRHLTESLDLGELLGEMRPFHSEIDGSVENGSNIRSNHFLYPYKGYEYSSISFHSTIWRTSKEYLIILAYKWRVWGPGYSILLQGLFNGWIDDGQNGSLYHESWHVPDGSEIRARMTELRWTWRTIRMTSSHSAKDSGPDVGLANLPDGQLESVGNISGCEWDPWRVWPIPNHHVTCHNWTHQAAYSARVPWSTAGQLCNPRDLATDEAPVRYGNDTSRMAVTASQLP